MLCEKGVGREWHIEKGSDVSAQGILVYYKVRWAYLASERGREGRERGLGCLEVSGHGRPGGSNAHLEVHREREGVGVPGCEGPSTRKMHF